MQKVTALDLKKLYLPPKDSHKGQNGKLMIIGGSKLFHGASLWALEVASRIVDLVHYASTSENNKIVQKLKEEFRNGIVIPRKEIESYIEEDDCILIGPGMVRAEGNISQIKHTISDIKEIEEIEDEGILTYQLTKYLLKKYPQKKWVIDAGSLQMMEKEWLKQLNGRVVLTPHQKEFERLFGVKLENSFLFDNRPVSQKEGFKDERLKKLEVVKRVAKEHNCSILLKGTIDIVCSPHQCKIVEGGNAGMTKGGTGDVLAGLIAALYCKNDAFLSACAASFINKKAGEELFKKVGYYFNASDLADQIPQTMKKFLG